MTKLTIINSKPINKEIEEELEEIGLPNFDIIVHEDDTWFDDKIKEIEEIRRIEERNKSMDR
jgi:hypothetical protein